MPADLHIHSNLSDGTNTPVEIVGLASAAGLITISLTDHDNVDGIEEAMEEGQRTKVEVIPGIEFTCEIPKAEIHILGYFIDYKDKQFLEILQKIQHGRVDRIYKITEKLDKLGVKIDPKDIFSISAKKVPGRPHVARAMVKKGIVGSVKEAFDRYLDFRSPAYVSHYKLFPDEAVKLIVRSSGLAVFAHPAISNCDEIIPDLIASGLAGIEVYYPGYKEDRIQHYKTLAKKYGLLMTGGSDFHGEGSGREIKLGDITISDDLVEKLKNEHLRGNRS